MEIISSFWFMFPVLLLIVYSPEIYNWLRGTHDDDPGIIHHDNGVISYTSPGYEPPKEKPPLYKKTIDIDLETYPCHTYDGGITEIVERIHAHDYSVLEEVIRPAKTPEACESGLSFLADVDVDVMHKRAFKSALREALDGPDNDYLPLFKHLTFTEKRMYDHFEYDIVQHFVYILLSPKNEYVAIQMPSYYSPNYYRD